MASFGHFKMRKKTISILLANLTTQPVQYRACLIDISLLNELLVN